MDTNVRVKIVEDLVEVYVEGKLTCESYQAFVPVFEDGVRQHGKLNVLFVMQGFHGWTAGALWDDLKFDLKHFKDIQRLALVGDSKWQKGMAAFCKPFTTAKVRYFPTEEIDAARAWLRGQPAGSAR